MTAALSDEAQRLIAEARADHEDDCYGHDAIIAEVAKSSNPEAARGLFALMGYISERDYCAGWLDTIDIVLWKALNNKQPPPYKFGLGYIDVIDIEALRYLHDLAGGWWSGRGKLYGSGYPPHFCTTAEWLASEDV